MTVRQHPRRAASGFSLLEVIAALVILSIGASAAFSWLSQSVSTMSRLRAEEHLQMVRLEVLDYLRAINPSARPEGAVQMTGYAFSWTSRPLLDAVSALNEVRAPGAYEVSLHEVTAHVSFTSTDSATQFDMVLPVTGFRQVGEVAGGVAALLDKIGSGTRPVEPAAQK